MGKECFKLRSEGTKYYIDVFGDLDEEAIFKDIELPNATEVFINFEGVKRIQSCGIREWIYFIQPHSKVVFHYLKCPKVIVDQMNLLEGFLPKGTIVESFYVPYYSEEFGTEKLVLFKFGIEFDENGLRPPSNVVDEKGNLLEMDVMEEKYFKFLTYNK